MLLATVSPLSKAYGARDLFQNVQLSVPHQARIGLVGPNGVGKTTLLRILIGEEEPTEGRVQRAKGLRIGYLPQNPESLLPGVAGETPLRTFVAEALADLQALETRLHALAAELGSTPSPQALSRYAALEAEFERQGGYTYHATLRRVLQGMGFGEDDFTRPLAHLSGGQRTRAYLARLLLQAPDLLVLDEPTNHLDMDAVAFLEGFLKTYPAAVLFVSHDRYFLDQVAQVIWELSPHGLETYRGNYTAYLAERQRRWEDRRARWDAEIARLHKDLVYIKRNIAGQNTSQAKGRLRRLSRAIVALEKGGLQALDAASWSQLSATLDVHGKVFSVAEAERRLRGLRFPGTQPPSLRLRWQSSRRSGDIVLRTEGLAVGYAAAAAPLFRVPDLVLRRGECVALIGPNGAGKTTFLKTILGQQPPYAGQIHLGASLRIGYFAQAAAQLRPQDTVLQALQREAPHLTPAQASHHLARYLFRGDDIAKLVAALSGGERSRLVLAQLALQGANFLLLDEPTNHLDIPAQEALQALLAEYDGTILLVSHDRYLVRALASQIWEIQPAAAALAVFRGGYEAYLAAKARTAAPTPTAAVRQPARPRREEGLSKNQRRRIEREIARLEEAITTLEGELTALEAQLANPPADPAAVRRLGETYTAKQNALEDHYRTWEALHAQLEG